MIESIYTEALLAAAAYAEWNKDEAVIKEELINERGFTAEQYDTFFDSDNGLYIPNGYTSDFNGFSATIFEEIATGKLIVSFRGTDSVGDVIADLKALLDTGDGFFGQNNSIDIFLESNNLLANGQLTEPVNFTGHSLGGYLSIIAAYKYSSSFGEAYTFNGLGLNPLESSWETLKSIIAGRPLDETKVHNYYADKGWKGASNPLLSRPGGQERVFIEQEGVPDITFENHSISKLVQSLSVYRVLNRLDPTLDQSKIYNILDRASNVAAQSLETTIDKLGDLLGGTLAVQTNKNDIELFYQGVDAHITNLGSALTLQDVASLSGASQLNTIEGQAYRYALVNLNSFAKTAATGAFIFCIAKKRTKKGNPDTAIIPQRLLFFVFAYGNCSCIALIQHIHVHNSLCSNNALTHPKNNRHSGHGIRGIKPTAHPNKVQWRQAA